MYKTKEEAIDNVEDFLTEVRKLEKLYGFKLNSDANMSLLYKTQDKEKPNDFIKLDWIDTEEDGFCLAVAKEEFTKLKKGLIEKWLLKTKQDFAQHEENLKKLKESIDKFSSDFITK